MPSIIICGALNSNTPQQNAGAFFGEFNFGGWDANIKLNQGHGGLYGFFNLIPAQLNVNLDNLELIDGAILDQDLKAEQSANI
ncbi:hypothetical protein GCM10010885_19770 [Alicyclobacillus cellulosilyticus]|uniref:Uncharacterized protein n=1 Tax=Alicyclobacillus cellulosilyticus TaxID=1003997 RepID=A0A917NM82_9BACL|nr:hypothetical protein [Alicyclobacillus cellulosilyticus]GGJ10613.1 hypothetical protein GCM10010885_19770 [Alicyclobacillus cellulosilyticus]